MGAAIPVMHYTGMAASSFSPSADAPDLSHAVSVDYLGIAAIAIVTFMVLGLTVLTSIFDRRYSARSREVEAAEARYRSLFERSLAGVLRTTLDGRILECNEACAHIFGFSSREEMMKTSINDRYSTIEERRAFLADLQSARSLVNYECRRRRKDGSPVWLRMIAVRGKSATKRCYRGHADRYHRAQACGED
jgi:PAS domain S-box-containing protein